MHIEKEEVDLKEHAQYRLLVSEHMTLAMQNEYFTHQQIKFMNE